MQITLVQTTQTLELQRPREDGTVEDIGSFEISISDPAFIKKSEQLIAEIEKRGINDIDFDYDDLSGKARVLLERSIAGGKEAVDGILGEKPDFFNSLLLLTAVMKTVNTLDPGRQFLNQFDALVPNADQLMQEAMAAKKTRNPRGPSK